MMRFRKIVWYVAVSLAAPIVLLLALSLYYSRNLTVCAPGFTEPRFAQIKVGMTAAGVHSILGEPLLAEHASPFEIWEYGESIKNTSQWGVKVFNIFSDRNIVAFDSNGRVRAVDGTCSTTIRAGMSKEDVTALIGAPSNISASKCSTIEYYALPDLSREVGRYEKRAVGFNAQGTVCELIRTKEYYD